MDIALPFVRLVVALAMAAHTEVRNSMADSAAVLCLAAVVLAALNLLARRTFRSTGDLKPGPTERRSNQTS
ncbi:MAG TPA: hypothetical protein VIJ64_01165 [Candidatus Lustribacter sp.]